MFESRHYSNPYRSMREWYGNPRCTFRGMNEYLFISPSAFLCSKCDIASQSTWSNEINEYTWSGNVGRTVKIFVTSSPNGNPEPLLQRAGSWRTEIGEDTAEVGQSKRPGKRAEMMPKWALQLLNKMQERRRKKMMATSSGDKKKVGEREKNAASTECCHGSDSLLSDKAMIVEFTLPVTSFFMWTQWCVIFLRWHVK